MALPHLAFLFLISLIWGFNVVASKIGVTHFPPFLFTALRFALVLALLAPFLRWFPGRMRQILMIGVFAGSLHFGLIFTGLSLSSASVTGIVTQLNVPFVTLLSIVILGEVVRWRRWLGMALAFSGVMVISFDPAVLTAVWGIVLVALGAFSIAFAMIVMRQIKGVPPLQLQAWVALLSLPPLLAASLLTERDHLAFIASAQWQHWTVVAYTAIGATVIGHAGFYWLLQRYEASLVGPFTLVAPVFTVLFGVWLLDDPMTIRIAIGGALTLLGVLIIAIRQGQVAPTRDPVKADSAS